MNQDGAATDEAEKGKPLTIEEKIELWNGWDDSKWQPDWMKVYNRSVSWAAGGGIAGALHALSSGRSVVPNAILFAGYTAVISGTYYASREVIFGREIERFRQESLALGLPETVARDYPWRWDVMCGGISGAVVGLLGGHRPTMIAASAALFSGTILAVRLTARTFSDHVLPIVLPDEYKQLQRGRQMLVLTEEEIAAYEQAQYEASMDNKSWFWRMMPSWFPLQVYTKKEYKALQEDKEYDAWLQKEVEAKRLAVGIKRKVRELEEANGSLNSSGHASKNDPNSESASMSSKDTR